MYKSLPKHYDHHHQQQQLQQQQLQQQHHQQQQQHIGMKKKKKEKSVQFVWIYYQKMEQNIDVLHVVEKE